MSVDGSQLIYTPAGGEKQVAMYLTMLAVRHKTKHKRFMIGLPLIMIVQTAAIALVIIYT